jgi:hypothetical protein
MILPLADNQADVRAYIFFPLLWNKVVVPKNPLQAIFWCVDEEIDEDVLGRTRIGKGTIADGDTFETTNIESITLRTHDRPRVRMVRITA